MAIDKLGLLKTTLLDYPGEVAATVFTSGCNLRCPYCHNPELVYGEPAGDEITVSDFLSFVDKRKSVLGGICCITGGEPLIHEDLKDLIFEIKKRGLKVKLDTNGTFPDRMKHLAVDYISMDLKTGLSHYEKLLPNPPANLLTRIKESIDWLKSSGIAHSFRTTAVPDITTDEDMDKILQLIRGENRFYLSGFRPGKTLSPDFCDKTPYPEAWLTKWKKRIETEGIECILRSNLTATQ